MKGRVVNIKNHQKTDKDVYIGRGSKWGNPFTHLDTNTLALFKVATRKEAIEKYEEYLKNSPLINDLEELRDKTLVCFCKPKSCHGDILLKLLNEKSNTTLF